MFDTIVTRQVARPSDIWKILELMPDADPLIKRRWAAEKALTATGKHFTIDQIYAGIFPSSVSVKEAARREIELDMAMQVPRLSLQKFIASVRKAEIPFAITSDTVFDEETLRKMVRNAGIKDDVPVFSSCHESASKAEGRLYKIVQNKMKIAAKDILHVGDNEAIDIEMAQANGLFTRHIKSPLQNYLDCSQHAAVFAQHTKTMTAAESVCVGIIKNRWFDTPATSPYHGNPTQFGHMAYGPALMALSLWMIRNAKAQDVKHITFVARDGYIVKKCVDAVIRHMKLGLRTSYLLASRHFSTMAQIFDVKDLNNELAKHNGDLLERLVGILGPCIDQIDRSHLAAFEAHPSRFASEEVELYQPILDLISGQRVLYKNYINQIGVHAGDALFDIGYQGTSQRAIENITGVDLHGFYIMTFPEIKKVLGQGKNRAHAFLSAAKDRAIWQDFERYRQLTEAVLSAPSGSFLGFEPNEKPILGDVGDTQTMTKIHDGISQFVEEFSAVWPLDMDQVDLSKNFALAHLLNHYKHPTEINDVTMLANLFFDDGFRKDRRVPFADEEKAGQDKVIWKEGQNLLHTPLRTRLMHRAGKKFLRTSVLIGASLWIRSPAKKRKINRDPIMFFSDSSNKFVRQLTKLFY